MKRAVLWLGSLLCLTLLGLYAYAWFTCDPLVAAFESIEVRDTIDDVVEKMGRQPHQHGIDAFEQADGVTRRWLGWARARFTILIYFDDDGRMVSKEIWRHDESFATKAWSWIQSLSTLWSPSPNLGSGINATDMPRRCGH